MSFSAGSLPPPPTATFASSSSAATGQSVTRARERRLSAGTGIGIVGYNKTERGIFYSTSSSTPPPPLPLSTTTKKTDNNKMASDADYLSFLDKANQDPNEGYVKSESTKAEFKATDKGVEIPTVLKKAVVDAFYTSDADEPFEVVGLRFEGAKLPTEGSFVLLLLCPSLFPSLALSFFILGVYMLIGVV